MSLFDWFGGKGRRDRFAKRVVARLEERGWPHPIQYDPVGFTLALGGEAGTVALHRTFFEWRKHPERGKIETLDDAIGFIFELGPPPSFDVAVQLLRPVIRARASLEAALMSSDDLQGAWRPVGEHLAVLVGIDRPNSRTTVVASTLKDWGHSFEECLDLAVKNQRDTETIEFDRHASGFHIGLCDDRAPVARLLTPEVFASLPLRGDPVVVAASRICLLVAGSEDDEALDGVADFVPMHLQESSWPLSYAPMVFRQGRWQTFEPAPGRSEVAALHTLQALFNYADQRPFTEIWLEEQGRSDVIADLAVFPTDEGLRSLVLWNSPSSLLPRADFVVRRLPVGGCIVRAWADVDQAFGGFDVEPPEFAPYFTVPNPIDPEALRRLQGSAEPDFAKGRGFGISNRRLTVFG